MLLLGHRGARLGSAENTLAAFELCLAHGCDGFEFDVRPTADGVPIICHDERIGPATVAHTSYTDLLRQQPSLATLEQVLERFAARAYLYIELKTPGVEGELLRALAAHPPQRGFVVASFLPQVIKAVHQCNPVLPLGFIVGRRQLPLWRSLPVSVVMPHHSLASDSLLREVHAAGKLVFSWTVNRSRRMRTLAARGVDGVLSDDTELLVRTLRSLPNIRSGENLLQ